MSGFKASIFWTNYMANAVETLEKLERRLTVSIPVADITTEVEKRLKVRARTAKASGFRQGKVPMDMVASMYGAGIQNDVLNEKISSAFSKAVEENNLRVAGYPKFEEKPVTTFPRTKSPLPQLSRFILKSRLAILPR